MKKKQKAEAVSVRKAVEAVHIAGKLSLLDRKLFNCLLFYSFKNPAVEKHSVSRRELCAMAGYDSQDDRRIRQALKRLNVAQIEWNVLGKTEKENVWGVSTLLASAVLKAGKCEYSFSAHLREKLMNPKIYTSFYLAIQRRFTAGYALALYENIKRFEAVRSTGWIEIKKFRKLLGADADYYDNVKMLNYRIVRPALAQINKYSDITASVEYKRVRRKIVAVRFAIRPNKQPSLFRLESELLKQEAARCWKQCHGNCGAVWFRYQSTPDHACHVCVKFTSNRLASGSS